MDFFNIDTIIANLPVLDVVEPIDQIGNRCLTSTCCTNKGNFLPRLCIQIDLM